MDYKSILKELNIDITNITYKDKVISTTRGNTRGFEIPTEDLTEKVFDMYIPLATNTEN